MKPTVCTVQKKDGRIYARLRYKDELGKVKEIYRRASNKSHARELKIDLLTEFAQGGATRLDAETMAFNDVADAYAKDRHIPAEYDASGHRVAGVRSLTTAKYLLQILRQYFGFCRIRHITHSQIKLYKRERLKTKSPRTGRLYSASSINRELEKLRAVLRFAVGEGWLRRSPFEQRESLISKSSEPPRARLLSRTEEEKLLAACTGRRAHLRPIVICALDTGMRRGEILKLCWQAVDFARNIILIRADTTKTLQGRQVAMTKRLRAALLDLWEHSERKPHKPVFGISDFRKGWASACKDADLQNLQFRDLRRTANVRMQEAGIPQAFTMKILGHNQERTNTKHYTAVSVEMAQTAARALESYCNGNAPAGAGDAQEVNEFDGIEYLELE